MAVSGIQLYQWMKANAALITTARWVQTYRTDIMELWVAIHTKEGKKFISFRPPEIPVFADDKKGVHKETGFGTWCRDNVDGGIITSFEQVRSERVIHLQMHKGKGQLNIYVELFGKGNVLICDAENIILMPLTKTQNAVKGQTYTLPPQFDTFHATKAELEQYLASNLDENASRTIATKLNLGGAIAEIICEKIGVAVDAPSEELQKKISKLHVAIAQVLEEPFSYDARKEKPKQENEELKKIQVILTEQKKHLVRIEKEIAAQTKVGDYIYEQFQCFQALQNAFAENQNLSEADIQKILKQYDISAKLTYKKPELTLEIL